MATASKRPHANATGSIMSVLWGHRRIYIWYLIRRLGFRHMPHKCVLCKIVLGNPTVPVLTCRSFPRPAVCLPGFVVRRAGHEYVPGRVLLGCRRTQDIARGYPGTRGRVVAGLSIATHIALLPERGAAISRSVP